MNSYKLLFYSKLEGWLSICVNFILFLLKYWAGITSGSIALIADAWHTLSDSISSIIVLTGIKISSKPADKDHPFGHGRAELIASIIIGVILAIISFNFIVSSVEKFQNHEAANYGLLAIIITIISIVAKEGLAQYAFWAAKKTKSELLKADAWHHRSDALSSIVILAGIFLGNYFWWIDAALGIIVSLFLFYATYKILSSTISPLLGEKPDEELISKLNEICNNSSSENVQPHHIHIHKYGNHTELTFHIMLPKNISLDFAHSTASKIEEEIKKQLDIETTIHVEPID